MRRVIFRIVFVLLVLVFIGIQYIEVDRTNPPVKADLDAPMEIKNIFRTSCYDCHSNQTKWPWYSKVAPISWMIVDDVNEGRRHLNFSEWGTLFSEKREDMKKKIWEELSADEMPPSKYTYLHPDASLEITQKNILKKWLLNSSY
ncbi:MAG: heme-binding domain-containing protein [Melioribacteraceae bacterium]